MNTPIIVIGQQPNGFFPKRFFYAKIQTARELKQKIGGTIIWFCHDSDSDYRETITTLVDKQTGNEARLNFTQENKIQKKFSPLYAKRIPQDWQKHTLRVLPQYVSAELTALFENTKSDTAAGFCIRMYQKMGLLDDIIIVRSSDPAVRRSAVEVSDFFIDTIYEGETVRARFEDGKLFLHEGGGKKIWLPLPAFNKETISPARDSRFLWMQSVVHATHYVMGAGEKNYLKTEQFPEVTFVERGEVPQSDFAYTP